MEKWIIYAGIAAILIAGRDLFTKKFSKKYSHIEHLLYYYVLCGFFIISLAIYKTQVKGEKIKIIDAPIDMELTQDCLSDILRASERKITIEEIQRKVSEHYNIRLSDMIGPKRVRTYARPRQVAMYLSKTMTSRSLPEIGRRFGGRDHTTVMHGVKRIEALKIQDGQIAEDLELLRRALEA